jgi:heat shock protein HslJ
VAGGAVDLVDGRWEGDPPVEGAASRPTVHAVRDFRLVGDLDGDGAGEAVVLLAASAGGSGEDLYLAVVDRRQERLENLATTRIGDRVQIRGGRIEGARIFLDVVRAGPEDPACCPGELASLGWELTGRGLEEFAVGRDTGRLFLAALGGAEWVLHSWSRGEPAPSDPVVTLAVEDDRLVGSAGCNRYFAAAEPGEMPGDLLVGPAGATRRACPEPAMAVEARFLGQLGRVNRFGFLAGRLALSYREDGAVGVMLFDAGADAGAGGP